MKKIILIIMLLMCFVGLSQETTPRYYVVGKDTLGVVISIADAQKLDNDGDILEIYKQLSGSYNKSGVQYITIINKMQQQIGVLTLEIGENEKIIINKDVIIRDLKNIISNYKVKEASFDKELVNKNIEIKNLNKQIKKSFWQKLGGSTIALLVIGFLLVK
jgi:hypothetical protein